MSHVFFGISVKSSTKPIILVAMSWFLLSHHTIAQTEWNETPRVQTYFFLDYSGQIRRTTIEIVRPPIHVPRLLKILQDSVIERELNLLESQKKSIEQAQAKIDRILAARKRDAELQRAIDNSQRERDVQEFQVAVQDLEDILTNHQKESLQQILRRYQLRQQGFLKSIIEFDFGNQLGLDRREKNELSKKLFEVGNEMLPSVAEEKQKFVDQLLSVLPPKTQNAIRDRLTELDCKPHEMPFGVIIDQLVYDSDNGLKQERLQFGNWPAEFAALILPTGYEISMHGSLVRVKGMVKPDPTNQGDLVGEKLLTFLSIPDVQLIINLTETQIDQLQMINEEVNLAWEQLEQELRELDNSLNSVTVRRERQPQIRNGAGEAIKKLLSEEQNERLRSVCVRVSVLRRGLLTSLIEVDLAPEIKLTKAEHDKLKEKATEIREHLMEYSRKKESEVFSRIRKCLTESQQAKWDELLGDDLREGYCDLDLLSQYLRGIDWHNDAP